MDKWKVVEITLASWRDRSQISEMPGICWTAASNYSDLSSILKLYWGSSAVRKCWILRDSKYHGMLTIACLQILQFSRSNLGGQVQLYERQKTYHHQTSKEPVKQNYDFVFNKIFCKKPLVIENGIIFWKVADTVLIVRYWRTKNWFTDITLASWLCKFLHLVLWSMKSCEHIVRVEADTGKSGSGFRSQSCKVAGKVANVVLSSEQSFGHVFVKWVLRGCSACLRCVQLGAKYFRQAMGV